VIGERTIEAIPALTLGSSAEGGIEVAFAAGVGMVGCSLRHAGEELLGQRGGLGLYRSARKTMGIPLLYPWANRLGSRQFVLDGREVNLESDDLPLSFDAGGLPMHGLLGAAAGWRLDRHESIGDGGVLAASFDFAAQPALIAAFPFPHTIELEARLDRARLTIVTSVLPTAEVAVPVSLGFHPYLQLPGVERSAWQVEIPVAERLLLDERMLPSGEREPAAIAPGPLATRTFDDAFAAPTGGAPFVLAGGGRRIELRLGDGYRFSQVYAPGDDDVIAFEPMTAPANALLLGGSELPSVAPGDRFTASFSIDISAADSTSPTYDRVRQKDPGLKLRAQTAETFLR
jgi:aldose 1-epimerase